MSTDHAIYLKGSLSRHILTSTVAGSIGLLALFAVDFVDMYFIGLLGQPALAAAVGYASTITFFNMSLVIGLSIASGVLIGKAWGLNDSEEASSIATHASIISVLLTTALSLIIWVFAPEIIGSLGASFETLELSVSYIRWVLPTLPFMTIAVIASSVLRAQGAPVMATYVTLAGGVLNAFLDPLFIFGFGLGLDGAAMASSLSRIGMCAVSLWMVSRSDLRFGPYVQASLFKLLSPLRKIAIPAVLANLATPVSNAFLVRSMGEFGNDAVAGFAVTGRVTPIAFALVFALSGAIGPIIAQNAGANRFDRVRSALLASYLLSTAYVVLVSLGLYLLRPVILAAFPVQGVGAELVAWFCGPLALGWIFNAWLFVANGAFNNMDHPFFSTSFNWLRHTLGTMPLVWLLTPTWGALGVIVGPMIGGALIATIAMLVSLRLSAHAQHKGLPQNDEEAVLHVSFDTHANRHG